MAEPGKTDQAKDQKDGKPSQEPTETQEKPKQAQSKSDKAVRYLYRGPSAHGLRFGTIYIGMPKIFENAVKNLDDSIKIQLQKQLFVNMKDAKPHDITAIHQAAPVVVENFDAIMRGEKLPEKSNKSATDQAVKKS